MSHTAVIGNISEPTLKYSQGGKAMCKFSLAENHGRFDKDRNEWAQIGTTWRQVTLWEEQAELAAEQLSKGQRVIAVGQERTREFTRDDGTEGSVLELQVDNIGPAIPKRRPQGGQQSGGFGGGQQSGGFGGASDPWGQQSSGGWGGAPSTGGGWDTPAATEPPPF